MGVAGGRARPRGRRRRRRFPAGPDCDDDDAAVHPGATEVCDLVDDDCNGTVDDGFDVVWYRDADGDGFGDGWQVQPTIACEPPAAMVGNRDDCDDADDAVHPGAVERCDGRDEDCRRGADDGLPTVEVWQDRDGDGFGAPRSSTIACAAEDPPGAWYLWQADGTHTLSVGPYAEAGGDCDDFEPEVHPDAPERCDGWDDDCDGEVDDGVTTTVYEDADGDGFGDDASAEEGCATDGWVVTGGDCDDADPSVGTCDVEPADDAAPTSRPDGDGCGCASGPGVAAGLPVALGLLASLRRRAARS